MPEGSLVGTPVKRVEDARFITGKGNYTDDINRPNQTYAYILRSPHAHARIASINTAPAKAAAGVVAVFTGDDMEVGSLPCGWQVNDKDGNPMKEPPHPPLAQGKVRYVGDQVAVVIAESYAQAKDAAELIEVDYAELPAVVDVGQALSASPPALVHDDLGDNLCYDWVLGDLSAVDAAFSSAHKVSKIDLVNNRLIPNAMEPRAAIGEYEGSTGDYTLYTTSQNPHVIRLLMGAFVLQIPEHKLRVVAPDVGGGFGSKIYHYAEEAIVTWASPKVGRPIKWTAERSESFMTDAHGRDHVTHAEMAMDADGKFLALKVETVANMGAYLSTFAPCVPTYLYATLLAGVYKTPVIYCNVKAAFTNTVPVDAYRGAGRPECTYLLERLTDICARDMGMDPAEIRRRNFIQKADYPYQTPVALCYDSGDVPTLFEKALADANYSSIDQRKADSKARGKLRGVGLSTYTEACGIAPSAVVGSLGARAGLYECGQVRVHPTGSVTVFTGTHSHGQGHETTFAQLVADQLGLPIENIEVVHGDTAKIPFGMGTYGSRSAAVGGVAITKAVDKVIDKAKKIAAHLMEASADDVEFSGGNFTVAGTDKSIDFGTVALTAYVPHNYPIEELEPGLEETAFFDPLNFSFPTGCHVCEVEVDPDTGVVDVVDFVVVDDFGKVINPMIVDGQVHGGVAQGIGQALLEGCVYDENGQLMTGSYMDYCMPRADNVPFIVTDYSNVPAADNPLGVKGCGEVGAIGSPPAVINAILDALRPLGVTDITMPATSQTVWQAIQSARPAQAAE